MFGKKQLADLTIEPGRLQRADQTKPSDVDDRLRKGLRRFLRQVVADAAVDRPVLRICP